MQNNINFSTNANQTATATVKPVQQSFFEPVQTSLFSAPTESAPSDEPTRIRVHCDICSDHDFATSEFLEAQGWGLYGDFEFCPYHEAQA